MDEYTHETLRKLAMEKALFAASGLLLGLVVGMVITWNPTIIVLAFVTCVAVWVFGVEASN